MNTAHGRDWLIDVLIVGLAATTAILVLPLVIAWCIPLSLYLGQTLFWVHHIAFCDFLPHMLTGSALGAGTALLIQHRKLSVALLPSILLCLFYALYFTFGPYPRAWGAVLWLDMVLFVDWLLLISASLLCGRLVLRWCEGQAAARNSRRTEQLTGS
jgi:hypothetical protein